MPWWDPIDGGLEDPQWPKVLEYLTKHYGDSPLNWGDSVYYRLQPHWMVAYGEPDKLLANVEAGQDESAES